MTTLREAAQQALEALMDAQRHNYALKHKETDDLITALRAALAEPVQEPAAKVELMTAGGNAGLATRIVEIDDHLRERLRPGQLLYTAPPQRKPLTEEEIQAIWAKTFESGLSPNAFARRIERAHKVGADDA